MISRWFRGAIAFFFALLFLLLLHEPFRHLLPETDLWWMGPAFSYHLEGRAGFRLFGFLLGPAPSYFAFPSHKLALGFLDIFRLPLGAWGWVTAFVHLANAFGLAWLCRMLRLSRRASFLTGLTFLSLFIHFHAIVWLPGSQHVLTLFAILSTLLLFLGTERRIREGRGWRTLYGLTLFSTAAASLQNAALLAPLLMLLYILVHPVRRAQERTARYLRWVPAFFAASLYPVAAHSFSYVKPLLSGIQEIPVAPSLKALGLLSCVAAVLAGIGFLLHRLPRLRSGGWVARILLGAAAAGVVLFLLLRDSRQVLLPYHALVPFAAVLSSFLNPFGAALSIDSASKYHYLSGGLSATQMILSCLFLLLFARAILSRKRDFLLFGVWYAVALLYLLLHRHAASSMPFQEPSRYFMYVTPVFCVVFCPAALLLYLRLARRLGWRRNLREVVLILIFALFWAPNLLAIRVALLRGRLANTYYLYDDLRVVRAIGEDLRRHRGEMGSAGAVVDVAGVEPIAFKRKWDWPVPPGQVQDRLFRQLAEEDWGREVPVREIRINDEGKGGQGERLYRIQGGRILGPEGPLEEFPAKFDAGVEALRRRRYPEAAALLEAAARKRPFLLNYLLTPAGRLSDLRWIIQGADDLEDWLAVMGQRWRRWSIAPPPKWERVSGFIRAEMEDYRRCLFYLAYLRWREGRSRESIFWLSRLRYLESDRDRLRALLLADPLAAPEPGLARFLEESKGSLNRYDPLSWRKEDYSFGRWLVRILLGRDVRSRWDRQFPEPP